MNLSLTDFFQSVLIANPPINNVTSAEAMLIIVAIIIKFSIASVFFGRNKYSKKGVQHKPLHP